LGVVDEDYQLTGGLVSTSGDWDPARLTPLALERRADLHARQAALAEADSRVGLAVAGRFGNPTVGPAYEVDPASIHLIGVQLHLPLPVFNTRRGEILQRQAERDRAALELQQTEVQVRQDVQAALARIDQARAWLTTYQKKVLPGLEDSLTKMNRL